MKKSINLDSPVIVYGVIILIILAGLLMAYTVITTDNPFPSFGYIQTASNGLPSPIINL